MRAPAWPTPHAVAILIVLFKDAERAAKVATAAR
jgi:hypothetical protein